MVVMYLILVGNYYTIDPVNLEEWWDRIKEKCGAAKVNTNRSYQARSLIDAGLSSCGYGTYLALMFKAKTHPDISVVKVRTL